MRILCLAVLLLAVPVSTQTRISANSAAQQPTEPPLDRSVEHIEVNGASRLAALARLGSLTGTSLLVEVDYLPLLQEPITITLDHTTVAEAVRRILPTGYMPRQSGALLILAPPAGAHNRMLKLPLGTFVLHQNSLSGLLPYLGFRIREVTACHPQGYGWSGDPMSLAIPEVAIPNATFETIVRHVADAPEPSMWIVVREPSTTGCISHPDSQWQVGLYGFGHMSTNCQTVFRVSSGPSFIPWYPRGKYFPNDCRIESPWQQVPLVPLLPPPALRVIR